MRRDIGRMLCSIGVTITFLTLGTSSIRAWLIILLLMIGSAMSWYNEEK